MAVKESTYHADLHGLMIAFEYMQNRWYSVKRRNRDLKFLLAKFREVQCLFQREMEAETEEEDEEEVKIQRVMKMQYTIRRLKLVFQSVEKAGGTVDDWFVKNSSSYLFEGKKKKKVTPGMKIAIAVGLTFLGVAVVARL